MPFVSPNRRHDRSCFYKYATADTTRRIVSSRSLRWSSPLCFNDPFDVPRDAVLSFGVAELQTAVHELLLAVMEGTLQTRDPVLRYLSGALSNEMDQERRQLVLAELRESLAAMAPTTSTALDDFRRVWNEIVPTLRILCLSEVNDSVSMWAYYTDNHTGAVLQFEASDELDSSLLLAHAVTYSDSPPALPPKEAWARALVSREPIDWQEYFKEYHYVKSMQWSHEREWRVVSYSAANEVGLFSYKNFSPRELSAVFLGAKMSRREETAILNELRGDFSHVVVHKALFDHSKRSITFEQIHS